MKQLFAEQIFGTSGVNVEPPTTTLKEEPTLETTTKFFPRPDRDLNDAESALDKLKALLNLNSANNRNESGSVTGDQGPYSQHFILFVTYEWAK
jgi:hypothetical protein